MCTGSARYREASAIALFDRTRLYLRVYGSYAKHVLAGNGLEMISAIVKMREHRELVYVYLL